MAFLPSTEATRAAWAAWCAGTGTDPATPLVVDRFGDSDALAQELVDLVAFGPKRATAGLLLDYEQSGDPPPFPGLHTIYLDGSDRPAVLVRTTRVEVRPLREVDEAFAWDEGEGDRSLASWKANHEAYFRRKLADGPVPFSEDLPVVLERFELLRVFAR